MAIEFHGLPLKVLTNVLTEFEELINIYQMTDEESFLRFNRKNVQDRDPLGREGGIRKDLKYVRVRKGPFINYVSMILAIFITPLPPCKRT